MPNTPFSLTHRMICRPLALARSLAKAVHLFFIAALLAVVASGLLWPSQYVSAAYADPPIGENGEVGAAGGDPPITVGAGWTSFSWSFGGQPFNSEGAFTFTSSTPVIVRVTDAGCTGDQFRIFDNGNAIGDTSPAPLDPDCIMSTTDPNVAFANSNWSSGSFTLGPGAHSITIQTIVNPPHEVQAAMGFIRVDPAPGVVPEASTVLLLGSGLAGLGAYAWLRWRGRKRE